MGGLVCEGSWRQSRAGLERWLSGECLGGVSGDAVVCGVGNSEVEESWVLLDFRWTQEEFWARFAVGRRGRVAGGFGEVGGGILEDLGGVSGFGLLWKEGVEDLSFLVDF